MATSTIEIDASILADMLPMLSMACRIVGSRDMDGRSVLLVIEGPAVPDVPRVIGEIERGTLETAVSLKLTFRPVDVLEALTTSQG